MCDMGVVAHGPGYITMGAAKKSQPSGHLYDLEIERRTSRSGLNFRWKGGRWVGALQKFRITADYVRYGRGSPWAWLHNHGCR